MVFKKLPSGCLKTRWQLGFISTVSADMTIDIQDARKFFVSLHPEGRHLFSPLSRGIRGCHCVDFTTSSLDFGNATQAQEQAPFSWWEMPNAL